MILPPALKDDARLSYALSCWHRWRGPHAWPSREDVDPLDFRKLLPNLFLVEVTPDIRNFRFILSGETVRENLGFELGSRNLEDLFHGTQLARIEACYRAVLAGQGHFTLQRWDRRGKPVMQFRRLLLPLSSDRARIDLILGLALYDRLDGHDGQPIDHISDPVIVTVVEDQIIPLDSDA